MNGWLIYNAQGAEKNAWFIQRLKDEAAKRGARLELKICDGTERFENGKLPDFAIVRSILPQINAALEKRGVRTFNNAKTAEVACDKWETYLLCKRLGIPVLPTVQAEAGGLSYPLVYKSRSGHGGAEVFWAESEREVTQKEGYILQKPCEILGKDMRVYAVGGEIVAAVLRESQTDFRSNYSLGGNVTLASADERQKQIVRKLYGELQFDFVGIDFLPTTEGWVLNEIEDAAGTRMLYGCSKIDIVPLFMEYVLKK